MAKTLTKEEFELWLKEHVESTVDDTRGDNKPLMKWLKDLYLDLRAHAAEQEIMEAEESGGDDSDDDLELDTDGLEDDE